MKHLKIFVELTRLNKPIGFMLLFWPCSWGLAYAYSDSQNLNLFIYYLTLFFLGSVLMRSAGCVVNDLVDRDFDKKVLRTKKRPLASGKISIKRSIVYVVFLCTLAFVILLQFNLLTILLGISSMFLAFSYPYMKRITYWPQLFLGVTFNWGIIMAGAAMNSNVSLEFILLYLSAIFWTLGYDTIYGAQDMSEDEIIGLKSTSIKFKNNLGLFVGATYILSTSILFYNFNNLLGLNLFTFFLIIFSLSLLNQVIKISKKNSKKYLLLFRGNNLSGALLFFALLSNAINL